jgi:ADP-ribose pyrophosphatase
MGKIKEIHQKTQNPYVNLYHLEVENKMGRPGNYYVASRAKAPQELQLSTKVQHPDGVIIYSLYGEKRDRVVLIRQYRYTIDDYIYELPAGLVEKGEAPAAAAVREMREETGLTLSPLMVDEMFEKPYYTTIGMTDECCGTVYGYASGEIRSDLMEESEEIEVVLADKEEVRRILREERVAIVCAYMMMHFLQDEEPFAFLQTQEEKQ